MIITPQILQLKVDEITKVFPWYKTLLPKGNITSLNALPLVTGQILDEYYYGAPVSDAVGVYETSRTSSNKVKLVSYSVEDEATYLDIRTLQFADFINGINVRKVFMDIGIGRVASSSLEIFSRLGLESLCMDISQPLAEHIRQLETFQPDVLYVAPSILDRILQVCEDPKQYGVRRVVLIGEIITENWVKKTAEAFGIAQEDIRYSYGTRETGPIATYCHKMKKYLLLEGIHAEALSVEEIDAELGALDSNERILVLTTFNRQFFPGLRFVTYDVVRDFGTFTVAGVERQGFSCIPRRVGTELKHGERLSIHDIEDVVFCHLDKAVIETKVKDNRLTVGVMGKGLNREILARIEQDIQTALPEIGTMIRGGLLDAIRVEQIADDRLLETGPAKKKRIV